MARPQRLPAKLRLLSYVGDGAVSRIKSGKRKCFLHVGSYVRDIGPRLFSG